MKTNNNMVLKFRTHIHCIQFDITRRCNLNCKFCFKGNAQDVDMTKEIVDKTFDSVENMCISSIGITGGEPLLNPDMICYIIGQIIERNLMVGSLIMYTNGTIKNEIVLTALNKFYYYAKRIEDDFYRITGIKKDNADKLEKIKIVISHRHHNTPMAIIEDAVNYYSSINSSTENKILAEKDSEDDRLGKTIILTGNAEKNHKQFVNNPIDRDKIGMVNEECFIINNYNYSKYISCQYDYCDNLIRPVISVSSNGNVYPGTRYSYEEADNNSMFNIMNCNNNFFELINSWSWEHPVNTNIRNFRSLYKLFEWSKKHNYNIKELSDEYIEYLKAYNKLAEGQENLAKQIHMNYPRLNHAMVDQIASLEMFIYLLNSGAARENIISYMTLCTYMDSHFISTATIEQARTYIDLIMHDMNGTLNKKEIVALLKPNTYYSQQDKINMLVETGVSISEAKKMLAE